MTTSTQCQFLLLTVLKWHCIYEIDNIKAHVEEKQDAPWLEIETNLC